MYVSKILDLGRGEGYGRLVIFKSEDIQVMVDNDEEEEGGWVGVQDEVDYVVKLDFEDFDDDDKFFVEVFIKFEREIISGELEIRW